MPACGQVFLSSSNSIHNGAFARRAVLDGLLGWPWIVSHPRDQGHVDGPLACPFICIQFAASVLGRPDLQGARGDVNVDLGEALAGFLQYEFFEWVLGVCDRLDVRARQNIHDTEEAFRYLRPGDLTPLLYGTDMENSASQIPDIIAALEKTGLPCAVVIMFAGHARACVHLPSYGHRTPLFLVFDSAPRFGQGATIGVHVSHQSAAAQLAFMCPPRPGAQDNNIRADFFVATRTVVGQRHKARVAAMMLGSKFGDALVFRRVVRQAAAAAVEDPGRGQRVEAAETCVPPRMVRPQAHRDRDNIGAGVDARIPETRGATGDQAALLTRLEDMEQQLQRLQNNPPPLPRNEPMPRPRTEARRRPDTPHAAHTAPQPVTPNQAQVHVSVPLRRPQAHSAYPTPDTTPEGPPAHPLARGIQREQHQRDLLASENLMDAEGLYDRYADTAVVRPRANSTRSFHGNFGDPTGAAVANGNGSAEFLEIALFSGMLVPRRTMSRHLRKSLCGHLTIFLGQATGRKLFLVNALRLLTPLFSIFAGWKFMVSGLIGTYISRGVTGRRLPGPAEMLRPVTPFSTHLIRTVEAFNIPFFRAKPDNI
ncbi:hypothetical protein C8R47DRAFT_1063662 [Mycena vitilis]|nr:hypothetical protein C8R47DRAFT_1063662 [Mycena vitilis]